MPLKHVLTSLTHDEYPQPSRACSVNRSIRRFAERHRATIRSWIPQGLRDLFNLWTGHAIRYRGVYLDWESATLAAGGYAEEGLFTRLETAALAVKRGDAAWEQDGVLYDRIPADSPVLLSLARVALARGGRLTVLDYGGAFGSTYRQCRAHLPEVSEMKWCIVEQPQLVASGRRNFQTGQLVFEESLESSLQHGIPDVAILSSVLQYLKDPHDLIRRMARVPVDYLIVDRLPYSLTKELITVQVVPPSLYAASYASWLFDADKFASTLSEDYELLAEWKGKDPPIRGRGIGARFAGSFWRRKERP